MADVKISDLPLRNLHPELRAAIAGVVGHEDFLFLVVAVEPAPTDSAQKVTTILTNSDEAERALRALAATGRSA